VWYEVDVMTDGLTVVNCKPLQSEGVDAVPDQSLSIRWVSSNGSTPGLVGKISADQRQHNNQEHSIQRVHKLAG